MRSCLLALEEDFLVEDVSDLSLLLYSKGYTFKGLKNKIICFEIHAKGAIL